MTILSSSLYGLSRDHASVLDTLSLAEILCPAGSTRVVGLTLVEITLTTAVITRLALAYSLAIGVDTGLAGTFTPVSLNGGANAQGRLVTSWATSEPTYAANTYIRQGINDPVGSLAAPHDGIIRWTFPENDPLRIGVGQSVSVRNITGGPSAGITINVQWKEFFA